MHRFVRTTNFHNALLDVWTMAPSRISYGIPLAIILTLLLIVLIVQLGRMTSSRSAMLESTDNIKRIYSGLCLFEKATTALPFPAIRDREQRPVLSWRVSLLPYLQRGDLYNQFHLDEPWDSPHNIVLLDRMPDVYRCPRFQAHNNGG